jgi:hypothetical protein
MTTTEASDDDDDNLTSFSCPICLESFKSGNHTGRLEDDRRPVHSSRCSHTICSSCHWKLRIRSKTDCPICRCRDAYSIDSVDNMIPPAVYLAGEGVLFHKLTIELLDERQFMQTLNMDLGKENVDLQEKLEEAVAMASIQEMLMEVDRNSVTTMTSELESLRRTQVVSNCKELAEWLRDKELAEWLFRKELAEFVGEWMDELREKLLAGTKLFLALLSSEIKKVFEISVVFVSKMVHQVYQRVHTSLFKEGGTAMVVDDKLIAMLVLGASLILATIAFFLDCERITRLELARNCAVLHVWGNQFALRVCFGTA